MKINKPLLILFAFLIMGNVTFAQKKSKKKTESVKDSIPTKDSQIKSLTNEALFINAMQAKVLGNYNEAIFRFNTLLKEDPNNAAAYFQLAQLYYSQNQIDKAESHAEKAVQLNPNFEWGYFLLSHIKSEKGDYHNAAKVLNQLIRLKPKEIDNYFDLASIYEKDEKYQEAIEVYEKIEKTLGIDEDVLVRKVDLYQKMDQKDKALVEIQKLIANDSSQFRYFGYLGDFYEQTGEKEKAIDAYQKIIQMDPGNILAYYSLADLYKKANDTLLQRDLLLHAISSKDIAVEDKVQLIIPSIKDQLEADSLVDNKDFVYQLVEKLIDAHPEEPNVYAFASETYVAFNEKDKAVKFLKELVKDTSTSKDIHVHYISMLSELELYDELYSQSKVSGKQFPEDPIFDLFAAIGALLKKDYILSAQSYQAGLNKEIQDPNLKLQFYAGLGDAESQNKNYDQAFDAYEKALEIDPNNATVLNNYAYFLSVKNIELNRAERMSRKSNLLSANNAAFQDTYAWIQYQKGNYDDALIWIEKALKTAEEKPSADMLDHYGDILFKLNKKEEAIEYWKKSLDVDDTQTEIADKIKSIQ